LNAGWHLEITRTADSGLFGFQPMKASEFRLDLFLLYNEIRNFPYQFNRIGGTLVFAIYRRIVYQRLWFSGKIHRCHEHSAVSMGPGFDSRRTHLFLQIFLGRKIFFFGFREFIERKGRS
jgi:hypothetical protein